MSYVVVIFFFYIREETDSVRDAYSDRELKIIIKE